MCVYSTTSKLSNNVEIVETHQSLRQFNLINPSYYDRLNVKVHFEESKI